MEPIDHYIAVGGVNTRYWHLGDQGEPVLLLHGGNGSIEFWLANLAPLAVRHRVYAFDMMGCGRSAPPTDADYSLVAQAKFTVALMDALGLGRAHVVGNSMGGGVAQWLAHTEPQRVEKLVLVAPLGWGAEINLGLRLLAIPGLAYVLRPNRAMIPAMVRWNFAHPENLPPGWMERRYQVFSLPGRQRAIASLARQNLSLWGVRPEVYQPLVDRLPQLHLPTLVIWGRQDRVLPWHQAQMAQRLPQGTVETWEDCGHHPFLEYPDRFNHRLLSFLAPGDEFGRSAEPARGAY